MFLRLPNSRAINLKVVKLYVIKKCVFLVVFGANQVGGRPGWAFRREIGYTLTWFAHVNPNPYEISSLNINTICLYLEISLYVKARLLYWNFLDFQLTGTDLTF